MKFFPRNTFVVVKKLAQASTSAGGIILAGVSDSDRCEVVAKSELVTFVDVGHVLLIRWSQAMKIDEQFYAIDAKDIVSIVE